MAETKLRELRLQHKLTQKEAAKRLDCPFPVYSRYERNERPCTTDILIKLSQLYNCSIECLLGLPEHEGGLSVKEKELVQLYREADPLIREDVVMLMKRHKILGSAPTARAKNDVKKEERL